MRIASGTISVLAAVLCVHAAEAHKIKTRTLEILHPWVHAAEAGAAGTDGFLVIRNTGKQADRLLGAVIDGVAEAVVVQLPSGQPDSSCRLAKGVEIAAGATMELRPGKTALRFAKVSKGLTEALYANGVLSFEKAGAVKVEFYIEAADAKSSGHAVVADCPMAAATQ